MGPGPTSGHWPRATAGGPSSWRKKGQVTRSEPSSARPPSAGGEKQRGESRSERLSRETRMRYPEWGYGEKPKRGRSGRCGVNGEYLLTATT